MKLKSLNSKLAPLMALTMVAAQLVQMQVSYAAPAAAAQAKPPAIPSAPLPQWPSPCSSNPCAAPDTPHWFYLRNVASVKAGQPLVMTVTTPSQPSQNNQPPSPQPVVTVGTAGTGITLQPFNSSPIADNQMWYASETTSGQVNPSYLISSLPAHVLPVAADPSLVTQQLALGYFGASGLSSSVTADMSTLGDVGSVGGTFGTVTLQFLPAPSLGQTINVSSTQNGSADGQWVAQTINGKTFGYSIPFEANPSYYNDDTSGNAVTMAAVYLNQQNTSSSYLNSSYTAAFQQWTYDASDQTICNGLDLCLFSVDNTPHPGSVVSAATKPSPVTPNYQWSFYPNTEIEQVLAQANIPFPPVSKSDYKKVTNRLVKSGYPNVAAASCNLDGVSYSGLRCEYSNLSAPLPAYLGVVSRMKTISPKTRAQLALELTDAIAVQNLFNQVLAVFNAVFLGNQDLISQDLGDLGMDLTDQTSKKKFDWQDLITGLAYTFLNLLSAGLGSAAIKAPVAAAMVGAGANLMQTSVDTYMGEQVSGTLPLANEFATTAADLYTNFYSRFLNLYSSLSAQETIVLTDWGKLALVGAMTQDTGPDGLAWDSSYDGLIIANATQAYQLSLMSQLLPQFFGLYTTIDWVGGNLDNNNVANGLNSSTTGLLNSGSFSGTPTPMPTPNQSLNPVPPQPLNQFAVPSDPQGAELGMWDAAWLFFQGQTATGSNLVTSYLTEPLAQDAQFANPYLLYSGFGLWGGFSLSSSNIANLNCNGAILTLTNYTPRSLEVQVQSSQNTAIGGGYGTKYGDDLGGNGGSYADTSDNSGIRGPVLRSLPPYGSLQVAGSTINGSGSAKTQTLSVSFLDLQISGTNAVASFQVQNFGCDHSTSQVKNPSSVTTANSYQLVLPAAVNSTNNTAGLVSAAIYGGS